MVERHDQRILEAQWAGLAERLLHRDQFLASIQQQLRVVDQRPQFGVGVQQVGFLADHRRVAAGDGGLGSGELAAYRIDVAACLELAANLDAPLVEPAFLQEPRPLKMEIPVSVADFQQVLLKIFRRFVAPGLGVDLREHDRAAVVRLARSSQQRLSDAQRNPRRSLERWRKPLRVAVLVTDLLGKLDLRTAERILAETGLVVPVLVDVPVALDRGDQFAADGIAGIEELRFDERDGVEICLLLHDAGFIDRRVLAQDVDFRGETERAEDHGLQPHLQGWVFRPQRLQSRIFPPGMEVRRLPRKIAAWPGRAIACGHFLRSRFGRWGRKAGHGRRGRTDFCGNGAVAAPSPGKGDSPIFVNHGFAAVPAKIGRVPRRRSNCAGVCIAFRPRNAPPTEPRRQNCNGQYQRGRAFQLCSGNVLASIETTSTVFVIFRLSPSTGVEATLGVID